MNHETHSSKPASRQGGHGPLWSFLSHVCMPHESLRPQTRSHWWIPRGSCSASNWSASGRRFDLDLARSASWYASGQHLRPQAWRPHARIARQMRSQRNSSWPGATSPQRLVAFCEPHRQTIETVSAHGPHSPAWHVLGHAWPHGCSLPHADAQVGIGARHDARGVSRSAVSCVAPQGQCVIAVGESGHGSGVDEVCGWHGSSQRWFEQSYGLQRGDRQLQTFITTQDRTHASQVFGQLHSPIHFAPVAGAKHSTRSSLAPAPQPSTTLSLAQKHDFSRTSSHGAHGPEWHSSAQRCRPQPRSLSHGSRQVRSASRAPSDAAPPWMAEQRTEMRCFVQWQGRSSTMLQGGHGPGWQLKGDKRFQQVKTKGGVRKTYEMLHGWEQPAGRVRAHWLAHECGVAGGRCWGSLTRRQ